MSKRLHVAIIGIGPSGLAAALAVRNLGGTLQLFSRSFAPSPLYGCQYLHEPLPGYHDVQKTRVDYQLRGTGDGYREKVYGQSWDGQVSPEDYVEPHDAWDLRTTYNRMYQEFMVEPKNSCFMPFVMGPERLMETAKEMRSSFDLIISTAPARALCISEGQHSFRCQNIYALGDAPKLGISCPVEIPESTIVCNGEKEPSWYRASRVFSHSTVEWPGGQKPPFEGVAAVSKPLWTDCDCFPWIDRIGRYGSWRKDVLVHDAYQQTVMLYKSKSNLTFIGERTRDDFCFRCGRIAYTRRALVSSDATEYRCLSGHFWEV